MAAIRSRWRTFFAALGLALVLGGCGPASSVLPPVRVHPVLKPVVSHPVAVSGTHPKLTGPGVVFTLSPKPLTRHTLSVFSQARGRPRRLLVAISGLGYKWLRRWQVADRLVLLEVSEPPSAHPRTSEYEHVLIALDWRTGQVLYQGPVAVTTIAYLDPPWLVKAGPASIIGTRSAVWILNLRNGLQQEVLLPSGAVGTGEVTGGRVYYRQRVHGTVRTASLPIPRTGWRRFHSIPILKLEARRGTRRVSASMRRF